MQFLYTIQTLQGGASPDPGKQQGPTEQPKKGDRNRARARTTLELSNKMLAINHTAKVRGVEASNAYEPRCLRVPRLPLLLLLLSAYIRASNSSS